MSTDRRGFTLIELIVAIGLSLVVMGVGYQIYFGALRQQDIESTRESMTVTVYDLMSRIKREIRSSGSVNASAATLTMNAGGRRIVYRATAAGVERTEGRGKRLYPLVAGRFSPDEGGANIELKSQKQVHRRAIRVEASGFAVPRN